MKNGKVYSLIYLISLLFMIGFVGGCSDVLVETKPIETQSERLEKDGLRIPDTYVQGIVYNGSTTVSGAYVQLLDTNLNVLASTTTNSSGFYSIVICPYGYGERIVKATYVQYQPVKIVLTTSEQFTFSRETGYANDWTFVIDLNFQPSIESLDGDGE